MYLIVSIRRMNVTIRYLSIIAAAVRQMSVVFRTVEYSFKTNIFEMLKILSNILNLQYIICTYQEVQPSKLPKSHQV